MNYEMIEVKKPFVSLQFFFFVLNIVPIALIALEAFIKRRGLFKNICFPEIRQNLEAYLQGFIFGKNTV